MSLLVVAIICIASITSAKPSDDNDIDQIVGGKAAKLANYQFLVRFSSFLSDYYLVRFLSFFDKLLWFFKYNLGCFLT